MAGPRQRLFVSLVGPSVKTKKLFLHYTEII